MVVVEEQEEFQTQMQEFLDFVAGFQVVFVMGMGRKSNTSPVPADTAGIRLRVHTVPMF
jgi:hypothetical protein